MADNEFQSTVESLFQGMNQFVSSKTVVGDPIYLGDTIILPLVDVSFAVGAGAASGSSKNSNTAITQAAVWAEGSTRAPCS